MIKHMVMWKIKDEFEGKSKQEIMANIEAMLKGLKGKVPAIKDIEISPSKTTGDMHYDMGLIVSVDTLDDLPLYINHPEHLKVREYISKVRTARVTADIEV